MYLFALEKFVLASRRAISAPGPPYDVEAYVGDELLRPSKLTPGLDKA